MSLTGSDHHAQVKPEFGEQPPPESEGLDTGAPEPIRIAEADMFFTTSLLLHSGQVTGSCCELVVMISNWCLQSLHSYSNIGMMCTSYIAFGAKCKHR